MDEMKVGEYSQIIHEPPGYSEEMRATEEEEAVGDQEKEEKREVAKRRMTYASQAVRPLDGRNRATKQTELYDAAEHWRLGLDAEKWTIEAVGGRVRPAAL